MADREPRCHKEMIPSHLNPLIFYNFNPDVSHVAFKKSNGIKNININYTKLNKCIMFYILNIKNWRELGFKWKKFLPKK